MYFKNYGVFKKKGKKKKKKHGFFLRKEENLTKKKRPGRDSNPRSSVLSAEVPIPHMYETDALPLGHRATLQIYVAIKILKTNTHNALGTSTSIFTIRDPPFFNKTTSVYRLVLLNKGLIAHERIYLYRLSSYKPKQILPSNKDVWYFSLNQTLQDMIICGIFSSFILKVKGHWLEIISEVKDFLVVWKFVVSFFAGRIAWPASILLEAISGFACVSRRSFGCSSRLFRRRMPV